MKPKLAIFKIAVVFLFFLSSFAFAQETIDLVDVAALDSTIIIDLKYATADNFMGDTLYSANICLLRKDVAKRLIEVQKELQQMGLGLKVWDGYRPLAVQKKMWEKIPDSRYVANPAKGSNHNRGAAVDVTLVDKDGKELEMPTGFDDFTEKAGSNYPNVSERAKKNRELLKKVMINHGFKPIKSEWWHFNDKNIHDYPVLDVPLNILKMKAAKGMMAK
ncbi:D-alanyl-D-alanine dipeptidase [candidate division KSB1 bacterium 4484_87]|nr:MAG: D-alanyl-D-alanine dipeptidase [candidate division KSB1 bacterium 4484_87]